MKTIGTISGYIILIMIVSCVDQAQNPKAILENKENRELLMEKISNDHDMMGEMISQIMQSDHAIQMMKGNKDMIGKMMGSNNGMMKMIQKDTAMAGIMMNNMMVMMENDSSMCKKMCKKMGANQHMMGMMHDDKMKNGGMSCPMHATNSKPK